MKNKLSIRRLHVLLLAGPSVLFLVVYACLSLVFVNATDKHLLTGHREPDNARASAYHRLVNRLHEKMLLAPEHPPALKTAKATKPGRPARKSSF